MSYNPNQCQKCGSVEFISMISTYDIFSAGEEPDVVYCDGSEATNEILLTCRNCGAELDMDKVKIV